MIISDNEESIGTEDDSNEVIFKKLILIKKTKFNNFFSTIKIKLIIFIATNL